MSIVATSDITNFFRDNGKWYPCPTEWQHRSQEATSVEDDLSPGLLKPFHKPPAFMPYPKARKDLMAWIVNGGWRQCDPPSHTYTEMVAAENEINRQADLRRHLEQFPEPRH